MHLSIPKNNKNSNGKTIGNARFIGVWLLTVKEILEIYPFLLFSVRGIYQPSRLPYLQTCLWTVLLHHLFPSSWKNFRNFGLVHKQKHSSFSPLYFSASFEHFCCTNFQPILEMFPGKQLNRKVVENCSIQPLLNFGNFCPSRFSSVSVTLAPCLLKTASGQTLRNLRINTSQSLNWPRY